MKESKSKDTYYLDGTYTYPNAVIDVYRPVISEEERARRMKRLERVVAEQLQRLLLRQLAALEHLLRLDQTVRLRIDLRAVALRHAPSDHFLLSSLHLAEVGIVIETVLQGGSDAQVHAVQILHRT